MQKLPPLFLSLMSCGGASEALPVEEPHISQAPLCHALEVIVRLISRVYHWECPVCAFLPFWRPQIPAPAPLTRMGMGAFAFALA